MLVGLVGLKQSGKDTAGKFLQYLSLDDKVYNTDFDSVIADIEMGGYMRTKSNFVIKKFADKIKDITCLVLGCSRERLEDEVYKNTPLGDAWNKTVWEIRSRHNLISTCYDRQSAEDDLAHYEDFYEQDVEIHEKVIVMTPRLFMQLLGTDFGRNMIHPDIWVNSTMNDYDRDYQRGQEWIITDVRFPNEIQAIKDRGGVVVRVNRFELDKCYRGVRYDLSEYNLTCRISHRDGKTLRLQDDKDLIHDSEDIICYKQIGIDHHESETALWNYNDYDLIIDNSGSLQELYACLSANKRLLF